LFCEFFNNLLVEQEFDPQQQRQEKYRCILRRLSASKLPGFEHAEEYLQHKYCRNMSINTIRSSDASIRLFLTFIQSIGRERLEEISRQDVEAFVEREQDRGLQVRAIRTGLVALYAFLNYLVKAGILPAEILQRKIRIKLPESLPRAIEPDDMETWLTTVAGLQALDRALLLLLLRTGVRIGELLNLQATDVNLQEQKILLYIGEKNAKGRVVYFCDDARDALMAWLRLRNPRKRYLFYGQKDRPLSYMSARRIFQKSLQKAGLPVEKYTLHQLRHTFATDLLNAGMRLEVLQQLLGHSTIEMTRHYARLTDMTREEEYFRAMQRIEREGRDGHY
jgi:integrase/recombinase XerD